MKFRLGMVLACLLLAGCAGTPPSTLPKEPAYLVTVKTVRIPSTEPWVSRFAAHTWFDLKRGSENEWERIEILAADSGVMLYRIPSFEARADTRWTNPVSVIGLVSGDEAKQMIPSLEKLAKDYPDHANYDAWPGPNSNTFVTRLARQTPGLYLQFNHNAAGKDYTPWFYAGSSVTGTGFQVDTLPLGFQVGWKDGIQLHFIQLTFGLSLFPPAIDLPIIPRIGWPATGF